MLRNFGSVLSSQLLHSNIAVAALHTSGLASASSKPVEIRQCNGVREVTFNEPETRNTLSMAMMECIEEQLMEATSNEQIRAIVLSSKGAVWSAGHNLKELSSNGAPYQREIFNKLSEIILNIYQLPVPVIAKVNGLVTAGGLQLAASCDMVVCSEKSSFSTPAAAIGIFCTTPGIAMARVMPHLKSTYMLLTGLPISAQEAYVSGLASVVVPEAELDAEMQKITDAIENKSRAVIALGKQFYYKQLSMNIKDAYAAATEKMIENLALEDGKEGLKSFVEKRNPKWTHK